MILAWSEPIRPTPTIPIPIGAVILSDPSRAVTVHQHVGDMSADRALRLAHRGDWRFAPENSLGAMGAALALPACDGLEFDVQLASDGVPVLLHDDTLERVQGIRRSVGSFTAAELAVHGIPTLAAVLATAGRAAFLDVELKGAATPDIVAVLEAARGRADGTIPGTVVSSFRTATLGWLRERRPLWPLWLNVEVLTDREISRARRLGCAGISAGWRSINARMASLVRDDGLQLAAWTVRRRSTVARLERLGVMAW